MNQAFITIGKQSQWLISDTLDNLPPEARYRVWNGFNGARHAYPGGCMTYRAEQAIKTLSMLYKMTGDKTAQWIEKV